MTLALDLVKEFHKTYNHPIRTEPRIDVPEKELRLSLIKEEVQELEDALRSNDLTETFDALLDIIWVTYGALITFGFPFKEGIQEVAKSNRSKLSPTGEPIYREDGKILKGPNFSPPDLERILTNASQGNTERL